MRIGRRSDLPLQGDPTSRFLPWLVAPMVFLCAIAMAGAFMLNGLIERWDRDVSGTLTVEIAAGPGEAGDAAAITRDRVEKVAQILRSTKGVANVRPLAQEQLVKLLAPWLGNSDLLKELPLPALIDVTLRPDALIDVDALTRSLVEAVPGTSVDDHRVWLAKLIDLSRTIELLAVAVVVLIGGVTSATVIYATRTGMVMHQDVIEVLHVIGAPDDYIARQFADRAFVLGLKGGMVGLALNLPVLVFIGLVAQRMEGGFLTDLSLPLLGWVAVLSLPALAALLAMVTAQATVHRTLVRLP